MIARLLNYTTYVAAHPLVGMCESFRAVAARARGHSALSDALPWMPWSAIRFLERTIQPEWRVFEYGSGGSTLYLGRRCEQVVSVEHDPKWSEVVAYEIAKSEMHSIDYRPIPPESGDISDYTSPVRGYTGMNFRKYVHAINEFPEGHFNLVVVDGRARNACARAALSRVRRGGYLLLDNSERDRYQPSRDLLRPYPKVVFRGLNPYQLDPGETTVWTITGDTSLES